MTSTATPAPRFTTLYLHGMITLANGQTRAATAYRASTDTAVTVTYVSGDTAAGTRLHRRIATAKQAATFTAYAWRSYLSADDVHAEALAEDARIHNAFYWASAIGHDVIERAHGEALTTDAVPARSPYGVRSAMARTESGLSRPPLSGPYSS